MYSFCPMCFLSTEIVFVDGICFYIVLRSKCRAKQCILAYSEQTDVFSLSICVAHSQMIEIKVKNLLLL